MRETVHLTTASPQWSHSNPTAKALRGPFRPSVSSLSAILTNLLQTAVNGPVYCPPIIPGLCCLWAGCPRLWPPQILMAGLSLETPLLSCSVCALPAPDGNTPPLGSGHLHPSWGLQWLWPALPAEASASERPPVPTPWRFIGWALPSLVLRSFKPRALPATSQLLSVPSS